MKSLINIFASTLFSLLGSYLGLIVSVYTNGDVLTAIFIALGFVIGCRCSGELETPRVVMLCAIIITTWVVAWFIFCPLIGERTPGGAPWYYHNRNDVKADIIAIAIGLIVIMVRPPNKSAIG